MVEHPVKVEYKLRHCTADTVFVLRCASVPVCGESSSSPASTSTPAYAVVWFLGMQQHTL